MGCGVRRFRIPHSTFRVQPARRWALRRSIQSVGLHLDVGLSRVQSGGRGKGKCGMRNTECGMGCGVRRFRIPHSALRIQGDARPAGSAPQGRGGTVNNRQGGARKTTGAPVVLEHGIHALRRVCAGLGRGGWGWGQSHKSFRVDWRPCRRLNRPGNGSVPPMTSFSSLFQCLLAQKSMLPPVPAAWPWAATHSASFESLLRDFADFHMTHAWEIDQAVRSWIERGTPIAKDLSPTAIFLLGLRLQTGAELCLELSTAPSSLAIPDRPAFLRWLLIDCWETATGPSRAVLGWLFDRWQRDYPD